MRIRLLVMALVLSGCASPLPPADPAKAWVSLYSHAGTVLMADRLNGERWPDGRYFQVEPGAQELLVRFQFEVQRGSWLESEPQLTTCQIRFRYADFAAGQHYRIEARPWLMKAQAWLYDDQRQVLARGQVLRCGSAY